MQKNSAEETYAIEVDTVTGEYFVRIPEWIVNDQGWFEDTELKFKTDKSLIFIEEAWWVAPITYTWEEKFYLKT